jgi:serine O-acetyltransferase
MNFRAYSTPAEIWATMRGEATREAEHDPMLAGYLYSTILHHANLKDALLFHLASKLAGKTFDDRCWMKILGDALEQDPAIIEAVCYDLVAVKERDPACRGLAASMLFFKGFQSLQCYRIAHFYWKMERHYLALLIQSRMSEVFDVDIHPAAVIGHGIFLDHAHGIVIGETAVVENNVSMLHAVTLGGTGKVSGDRHPKIREGVLISAGAKILGNIEVGQGATVAASSVVLESVSPHVTVAGIPAKVVGRPRSEAPALDMNQAIEDGIFEDQPLCPRPEL